MIRPSADYVTHRTTQTRFGFDPLETGITLKGFRALVQRKDMGGFIAIPVVMVISFTLPTLFAAGHSERVQGFFLVIFIPFFIPLMFFTTAIEQEGKAVINIYVLALSAKQLVKGKLLPEWLLSIVATLGAVGVFQIMAPRHAHRAGDDHDQRICDSG